MFDKILIANRGAIACRILRTLRQMGVRGLAVYSEADATSLHIDQADEAVSLGSGGSRQTYLDGTRLIAIARERGAQAIHPGYGFLSENADFAQACADAGLAFIGPAPEQLRAFGLKHRARELARAAGLPLLEGSGLLADVGAAHAAAEAVGYPVMLKSTAGGGGIGMRICRDAAQLAEAFTAVQRLGLAHFADAGVFVERYIERARHVEVQIFGDGRGQVIALGERDCSIQRRNQKVIEETPAPNLPGTLRRAMCDAAVRLGESVQYASAGTVEYVYDAEREAFYFLEVNTRLQVEHGVTEQVWGVDLVRWMVELAAGTLPPLGELAAALAPDGHAVQGRLYAEDPGRNFQPSPGLLTHAQLPPSSGRQRRVDSWITGGAEVPPDFDPMLAKLIAWAPTREAAIAGLDGLLAEVQLYGVETNRDYLRQILSFAPFAAGRPWTRCLEQLSYSAHTVEVLTPGTQTTVQDVPGRIGYWSVGIPPSGPMDARAFRLGNRLLGNADDAAGLEILLAGPTLRFNCDAVVAVTGATLPVSLDGAGMPMWETLFVPRGATLALGRIEGAGARAYLCLRGGLQVPDYLGSKSSFTLGQFGGHAGRQLAAADVLHLPPLRDPADGARLPETLRPALPAVRELRVMIGPHPSPDYFSERYIGELLAAEWEVHFNSSRTGVRLIGPRPEWTRADGGDAGLHPSNIHDNAYAIGAVDFTGDMPVILGPDGPSLGGFVCPLVVIEADLWQLGQLKAGDSLRFVPVGHATARALAAAAEAEIASLAPVTVDWQPDGRIAPVVLDEGQGAARLCARLAGDTYLLLEFGLPQIDLATRFRIDALMAALQDCALPGIVDITPGIRSLQLHYRPETLPLTGLLAQLSQLWARVRDPQDLRLPSRIVHLPLSWDDPATQLAIDKYQTTVRANAPWCPSNLEFIRRINGLDSIEDVRRMVFDAAYLVLGLGDVYLGAPVATPLDPRHRLVTTKYNPARTWTPENAVGIGGAYLCIYGMEGPGGYQLVGRTLQMWNRWREVPSFQGRPYLLRFFDQIRFFEVSAGELERIRRDFPLGRYSLRIEDGELSLAEFEAFCAAHRPEIEAFRQRQRTAFDAERAMWAATGLDRFEAGHEAAQIPATEPALAEGLQAIHSPVAGNLWQLKVAPGNAVVPGQVIAVLEAMKMEIEVAATLTGTVASVHAAPGTSMRAGQLLVAVQPT